jgi:hypothetical protein
MMSNTVFQGSCHCGNITFEAEGTLEQVMECNCSHCSRKGYLLWFIDRSQFRLKSPVEGELGTYTFNKHVIKHHFCKQCGCAPFGLGTDPKGANKAAVNVRCVEVDRSTLKVIPVDGKSY